jgi:hypothetical protein
MTWSAFVTSIRVFSWLLWFDIRFLWKEFFQNLLDVSAWPAAIIFVNGYVVQSLGMPANYGTFSVVSMLVMMGCYKAWTGSIAIASDLAGPQNIAYELTLPLPYWMVWLKNGLSLSIQAAVFNVVALFLGKIILGSSFDLSNFSLLKFFVIYAASSLFFGMFALWTTVITKTVEGHSRLEIRLIGPMFYLNGFTASWALMYKASPPLGIFVRCLPWIYAYEGCRAAILGQQGYLSLWLCTLTLVMFITLTTLMSVWLFKRRMDCV